MSSEWRLTALRELVGIKHGFAFKGEYFANGKTPLQLTTPGNFAVGGGFQRGKGKYYAGPVPAEYVLSAGDVIVSMTDLSKAADTLGYAAVVPKSEGVTWLHNQRVGLVRPNDGVEVCMEYVHYLMRSPSYRHWVVSTATGSTVKHTSPDRILAYEFLLPTFFEQKQIGSMLSLLDERIALLFEVNSTLDAIVQALFKSWFVDFDPVRAKAKGFEPEGMRAVTAKLFPDGFEESELGLVPNGWSVRSVYDIARVIYGAPFASKRFNTEGVGTALVRIRDLKSENPGVYTDELHPKGYMIQPGDLVVGMDGEFRAYLWGGREAWLNQRVCVFEPAPGVPAAFVHRSITPLLAAVEASETATTVIHLGKNDIDRFRVVVPNQEVLAEFSAVVEPIYARIVKNKETAFSLSALRDTLLPRLISGQLRLPEATAATEKILSEAV